jgi:UDP-GlcNAc:undecaprenyl-phosphate/decaprenyl-phosphate GlcNAc-1-phosphate transferase
VDHGTKLALEAFALGLALALLLNGPAARVARRLGAVDRPGGRRMHEGVIPLGGGLALLAGAVLPVVLLADRVSHPMKAILIGACLCALVGFADDVFDLPVVAKFAAQICVATVPVAAGVSIDHVTLPFLDPFSTGVLQYPLTILWIVGLMNVLNFVDGMDGLAAGVGAISAGTFCVLALSLGRVQPALIVAALAGACIGFLRRNFHPARVFMGDAGSMTIGFILASVAVLGVLKTAAAVAVGFPLVVLFVPLLDTSFVIARRLKYGQAPWHADSGHLHHRFARIGWGQRQAALLLYAWCVSLAGFALARACCSPRSACSRSGSRCTWSTCSRSSSSGTCTSWGWHVAARCRARRRSSSPVANAATRWRPAADSGTKTARSRAPQAA